MNMAIWRRPRFPSIICLVAKSCHNKLERKRDVRKNCGKTNLMAIWFVTMSSAKILPEDFVGFVRSASLAKNLAKSWRIILWLRRKNWKKFYGNLATLWRLTEARWTAGELRERTMEAAKARVVLIWSGVSFNALSSHPKQTREPG